MIAVTIPYLLTMADVKSQASNTALTDGMDAEFHQTAVICSSPDLPAEHEDSATTRIGRAGVEPDERWGVAQRV